MIKFLLFLLGTGSIGFFVPLYACRSVLAVWPDRKLAATIVAVLVAGVSLVVFHEHAGGLIKVKSTLDMGGLAFIAQALSYFIALVVVLVCIFSGIRMGLKRPKVETVLR